MQKSKCKLLDFANLEIRFFAVYGDKVKPDDMNIGKYGIHLYGSSRNGYRKNKKLA